MRGCHGEAHVLLNFNLTDNIITWGGGPTAFDLSEPEKQIICYFHS